jgi:hypothetical protein
LTLDVRPERPHQLVDIRRDWLAPAHVFLVIK